jgi:hypothetical protein
LLQFIHLNDFGSTTGNFVQRCHVARRFLG